MKTNKTLELFAVGVGGLFSEIACNHECSYPTWIYLNRRKTNGIDRWHVPISLGPILYANDDNILFVWVENRGIAKDTDCHETWWSSNVGTVEERVMRSCAYLILPAMWEQPCSKKITRYHKHWGVDDLTMLHLGAGHGTCFTPQEFDTIARLETQSIDAYNDAHHYRPNRFTDRGTSGTTGRDSIGFLENFFSVLLGPHGRILMNPIRGLFHQGHENPLAHLHEDEAPVQTDKLTCRTQPDSVCSNL